MKHQAALKWLIPMIGVLALVSAAAGLFYSTPGEPYAYTNQRGESVIIHGSGLYYYDTVSTTAQMQGNDLITLVVGLPLLAVAAWLAFRGALRGQLLLTGTLGFFLYTYMSMSMLTAYNAFFLVYVALFSLSLAAFILSLTAIDVAALPIGDHFTMGPADAARAVEFVRPKFAIPCHYNTFPPIRQDPETFRTAAGKTAPETAVVILAPGETHTF